MVFELDPDVLVDFNAALIIKRHLIGGDFHDEEDARTVIDLALCRAGYSIRGSRWEHTIKYQLREVAE